MISPRCSTFLRSLRKTFPRLPRFPRFVVYRETFIPQCLFNDSEEARDLSEIPQISQQSREHPSEISGIAEIWCMPQIIVFPGVFTGFVAIRDVSEMWYIPWESREDLFEIPKVPLICCMPRNLDFPKVFKGFEVTRHLADIP